MKISRPLSALCVLLPTLAWSSPVHNLRSSGALTVRDSGLSYTPASANATLSWTEGTGYAFINARATTTAGDLYEFQLVSTTASTTAYEIAGIWNVTKNGVPLCTNCAGHAYGLSGSGSGYYFKIYVDGETYGIAPYVTSSTTY